MTNEELVMEIKRGNKEKLNDLWVQVSDYVRSCAREFKAGDLEEDLIQESFFAIVEAAEKYDQSRGGLFLTYATYYIKNSMRRFLIKSRPGVRLPEHMSEKVRKYNRFVAAFFEKYGREPTDAEASLYMEVPNFKAVKAAALNPASLNIPVGEEGSELLDFQGADDDGFEDVIDSVFMQQLGRDLWGIVNDLPDQLRDTVIEKYKDGKTYQQIAEELHITAAEARGIMSKAMRKLRTRKELKAYYDELYGRACSMSGLTAFEQSWTSSTERAAFWLMGVDDDS